jgi:hypothetical protein
LKGRGGVILGAVDGAGMRAFLCLGGWGKALDSGGLKMFIFCMLSHRAYLPVICAAALTSQSVAQTTVQGEPFGYVKINITAGTGTAKKTTLVSIPLLEEASITGNATGRITGVTATTISASAAGWTAGELSAPATPHLIEITSGAAKGRMLLISTATANTADTVTVSADEATRVGDLTNLGIATGVDNGDTYRIRPVDTLSSFFGTPETTLIQGGTTANAADTITLVANGSSATYYFNTGANPPRWSRVALGSPDAATTPIPPYAGVQYARIANTPLEFIVTGKVPSGDREVSIKNSGVTLLAPFWPVNQTLSDLAIENIPNWASGGSAAAADTVVLSTGTGSVNTFFHDGSNWRRVALGSPLANSNLVPVGASIMINKKGSAAGFASYEHAAPYSFQ